MKIESTLMMMEAEKEQSEIRVLDQIKTLRNVLDSLESKIKDGKDVYESDGLQGNGDYLDVYLTKLVTYTKVIKQVKSID